MGIKSFPGIQAAVSIFDGEMLMVKNPTPAYRGLLFLSLLFTVAAFITLLPRQPASYPNLLGYKSVCTFAPVATAFCCLLAGITCIIRARFVAPRPRAGKSPAIPLIVLLVFILIAASFTPSYVRWKIDEVSSATTFEG